MGKALYVFVKCNKVVFWKELSHTICGIFVHNTHNVSLLLCLFSFYFSSAFVITICVIILCCRHFYNFYFRGNGIRWLRDFRWDGFFLLAKRNTYVILIR